MIDPARLSLEELKDYARAGLVPAKVELKRRITERRSQVENIYAYLDGATIPLNQAALKYDVSDDVLRQAVRQGRIRRTQAGRGGPGNVSTLIEKDVAIFVDLLRYVPGQGSWLLKDIYREKPLPLAV